MVRAARRGRARNPIPALLGVAALTFGVLAVPVKQRCGAPGFSCASVLDTSGNVHYYYEVEPLGVYLAEVVTGSNITLYYTSGEDLVRAR